LSPERAFEILKKKLRERELDLLLVTKRENVRYLTGFTGTFGVVVATPVEVLFVTDPRYTLQASQQCSGWKVEELRGMRLSQWILERYPDVRRIGVEEWLQVGSLERMKEVLKGVQFVVVFGAVEGARAKKEPEEVERIEKALSIAEESFLEVLGILKPGISEKEIALELEFLMRRKGAEGVSFDIIVASGKRSALPHGVASDKLVEKGDIVVLDFGCLFDGYCSDVTRVVKVGRVTGEERRVWTIVYDAHMKAVEAIERGERDCRDIHMVAEGLIEEAGFGGYFGHGLGHGVGLEIHEKPSLSALSEDTLEEGNVFTIEPGIYIPDGFGIRLENMYHLDKSGIRCLNRTQLGIVEV